MTDFSITVPEILRAEICWETCRGGIESEQIYIVTDEDYSREHEGWIGYIYNDNGYEGCFGKPYRFVFDGLVYARQITEEEVAEIIGAAEHKRHKERMKAVEALLARKPVEQYVEVEHTHEASL